MVLATVPEAPPTTRNHRATSWPAPISAKEPKVDGSRFTVSALWWVSSFSVLAIARLQSDDQQLFGEAAAPFDGGCLFRFQALSRSTCRSLPLHPFHIHDKNRIEDRHE